MGGVGRASRIVLGLLSAVALFGQADSPVLGVGPFLHMISDLDESLAFYHDALGLELTGPAGPHAFTDNPAVANLYGVPGKQFRAAVLKIPGSAMNIELAQWGESRKPRHDRIADPGAVTLLLRVADMNAVADRAVKAGQAMMDRSANTVTFEDPDGFVVEVQQSDKPGADLNVSVSDVSKTKALYASAFGFKADEDWLAVPGATVRIRLIQTTGAGGSTAPFPQPGRGMLRLPVRNIADLTQSLKGAGFSVITTGGKPVTLPQGPQVIIVRDPNNFYFQPMQAP
jgi:catechol 2,3-dioxygenase-like lactoylglutathione lyase family enzyme